MRELRKGDRGCLISFDAGHLRQWAEVHHAGRTPDFGEGRPHDGQGRDVDNARDICGGLEGQYVGDEGR